MKKMSLHRILALAVAFMLVFNCMDVPFAVAEVLRNGAAAMTVETYTLSDEAAGVTVSFGSDAIPAGIDPAKVKVSAVAVPADEVVVRQLQDQGMAVVASAAYDITLIDGETGVEFEPAAPVKVLMPDVQAEGETDLMVCHITGDKVEQIDSFAVQNGEVVFDAASFSVYGVYAVEYLASTVSLNIGNAFTMNPGDADGYVVIDADEKTTGGTGTLAALDWNLTPVAKIIMESPLFKGYGLKEFMPGTGAVTEMYGPAPNMIIYANVSSIFGVEFSKTGVGYTPLKFTLTNVDVVGSEMSIDVTGEGLFSRRSANTTAIPNWTYVESNDLAVADRHCASYNGYAASGANVTINLSLSGANNGDMHIGFYAQQYTTLQTANVRIPFTFKSGLTLQQAETAKIALNNNNSVMKLSSSVTQYIGTNDVGKSFPTGSKTWTAARGVANPIIYQHVDEQGNALPDAVLAQIPGTQYTNVAWDKAFTLADAEYQTFESVKGDTGIWSFDHWEMVNGKTSATIRDDNTTVFFRGVWTLAEAPAVNYAAVYVNAEAALMDPVNIPGTDAAAVTALLPENTASFEETYTPAEPSAAEAQGTLGTWTFSGWYLDNQLTVPCTGAAEVDEANGVTFYGKFVLTPISCTVTVEYPEDAELAAVLDEIEPNQVSAGDTVERFETPAATLVETAKGVWVFVDWYVKDAEGNKTVMPDEIIVAEDVTIVSEWRLIPAGTRVGNVTFHSNTYNEKTANQLMIQGESDEVPGMDVLDMAPVAGLTFLGWAESADVSEPEYLAGDTLFAQKTGSLLDLFLTTARAEGNLVELQLYAVWEKSTTVDADLELASDGWDTESDAVVTYPKQITAVNMRMVIDMADVAAACLQGDLAGAEEYTISVDLCLHAYMHGSKDAELPADASAYAVSGLAGLSVTGVESPADLYQTIHISGKVSADALADADQIYVTVNGVKYKPMVNEGVSTYHRVMTESLVVKAEAEDYSRSWTGKQKAGGLDFTQRFNADKDAIWVTWSNAPNISLRGDIQVMAPGSSAYDTENKKVVMVKDGDVLTYVAALDVSPIQQQIKDVYGSEVGNDQRAGYMEHIYLDDLVSTFTVDITFDDGLVYPTDPAAYTLIGAEHFAITDIKDLEHGVKLTMHYIGNESAADIKSGKKISETFADLYSHIVDETDAMLAMTIEGVKVDAKSVLQHFGFDDTMSFPMTVYAKLNGDFDSNATMYGRDAAITGVGNDTTKPFRFDWGMAQNHDLQVPAGTEAAALKLEAGEGYDAILAVGNRETVQLTVSLKPTVKLPADLQVMTPAIGDAPDTENAAVYVTNDQATLRYYAVLDVRSIQKQIADIASMMDKVTQDRPSGSTGTKEEGRWKDIRLTQLTSTFTYVMTVDDGLDMSGVSADTVKLTTNASADKAQHFKIISVAVEGNKMTVVMDYYHDDNGNDISFYDLYTDIVEDTATLMVMDIDGIQVDLSQTDYKHGDDLPLLTAKGTVTGSFYAMSTLNTLSYPFSFDWNSLQSHDLGYTDAYYAGANGIVTGEGVDYIIANSVGQGNGVSTDKVWLTVTVELTEVEVTKEWEDDDDNDGLRPESVTVQLLADGKPAVYADGEPVEELELTEDDNWTGVFADLPIYTDDGNGGLKEIEYTVTETPVEGYEEPVYSGNAEEGFVITNTHEPVLMEIPVTKIWSDSNNKDNKRPKYIIVNLLADGEVIETKQLTEKMEWKYTFTDLPVNKDGAAIKYTVTEEKVADYSTTITGSAADGFEITNKHSVIPETRDVTVRKVWQPIGEATELPESVTVVLKADGTETKRAALTEAMGWTYTFEDLPVTKNDQTIVYTVEELPVEGYTTSITGSAAAGFVITNTQDEPEPVQVKVIKIWNDNDDEAELRPATVTIRLYDDYGLVSTVTLSESNGWAYTFTNLPALRPDGRACTYVVRESVVRNYRTSYSAANGVITVTNTYKPSLTPFDEEMAPLAAGIVMNEGDCFN